MIRVTILKRGNEKEKQMESEKGTVTDCMN